MPKPVEVVTYRDLLLVSYSPDVGKNRLMLLFSTTQGDRVRNVFHPNYLRVGEKMSVRNGRHVYPDQVLVYERGWIFKKLLEKSELVVGTTTYTLYQFEVQFTRNENPAIPHVTEDQLVLAPYGDVHVLLSGTSQKPCELEWGYIGEEKLRGVLDDMKKLESMHA